MDLNVDVGEGFPFDADLLEIATSANVGCGAHAGSRALSEETVRLCLAKGVRVGAHPGLPDRASMGRGPWPDDLEGLLESVVMQVMFLRDLGAMYVKPHGTLYNASADRPEAAAIVTEVVKACPLPLMGLAGSLHEQAAASAGVEFIREGFVDRAYDDRGRLVPRSEPGAVVTDLDAIVVNALGLAARVDSLCVHGDTPGCVKIASAVRRALEADGFEVAP